MRYNAEMGASTKTYLSERLDYILGLMKREHEIASTHAQRNNYQAVIRIELEELQSDIRSASVVLPCPKPVDHGHVIEYEQTIQGLRDRWLAETRETTDDIPF